MSNLIETARQGRATALARLGAGPGRSRNAAPTATFSTVRSR